MCVLRARPWSLRPMAKLVISSSAALLSTGVLSGEVAPGCPGASQLSRGAMRAAATRGKISVNRVPMFGSVLLKTARSSSAS